MGKRNQPYDPRTRAEWQEAVDEAEFWLHVHAAVGYGFIIYSGEIDVGRCEEMLTRGRAVGVRPSPGAVERLTREKLTTEPPNITGGAA